MAGFVRSTALRPAVNQFRRSPVSSPAFRFETRNRWQLRAEIAAVTDCPRQDLCALQSDPLCPACGEFVRMLPRQNSEQQWFECMACGAAKPVGSALSCRAPDPEGDYPISKFLK